MGFSNRPAKLTDRKSLPALRVGCEPVNESLSLSICVSLSLSVPLSLSLLCLCLYLYLSRSLSVGLPYLSAVIGFRIDLPANLKVWLKSLIPHLQTQKKNNQFSSLCLTMSLTVVCTCTSVMLLRGIGGTDALRSKKGHAYQRSRDTVRETQKSSLC